MSPQECSCCTERKPPSQFKKFTTCPTKPCNTVCNFCWTQYLKTDFMENPTKELACFTCSIPMDKPRILELLLQSPDDRCHYAYCLKRFLALQNGERECIFADCKNLQIQTSKDDDRISLCEKCSRKTCIPCTAPEHLAETCEEYRTRLTTTHSDAESATAKSLAEGYPGRESVGTLGKFQTRNKRPPLPCPSCGIWIERFGGCLRLRCPVCKLDFCGDCAAPYLGRDSVPLKGNKAHWEGCHYFRRKVEDRRFRPAVVGGRESASEEMQGSAAHMDIDDSGRGQDESIEVIKNEVNDD